MTDPATLYDRDFLLWSKEQAEALRAAARGGSNRPIDWENIAEEIEDLGKSVRRELRSQIRRIIRHLVKLEHSPATDPRRGWKESIRGARSEIEDLLADAPSLAPELGQIVMEQTTRGIREALSDLEDQGEVASLDLAKLRRNSYTAEQILGDWFPEEPRI